MGQPDPWESAGIPHNQAVTSSWVFILKQFEVIANFGQENITSCKCQILAVLSLEPAGFRGEKSHVPLSTNEVFNEREALCHINDGLQAQTSQMPHLILPGSIS